MKKLFVLLLLVAAPAMASISVRRSPYNARPGRTTRNSNDFVFANGGRNSMLSVKSDGAGGYVASITMGVVRS